MFWLYSGNVSPINNHYYLSESRSSFEWMLIFYSCICADAYQCFLYVFLNLYPDNYTNLSLSPSFLSLDWTWKREKEVLTSVLLSVSLYWMYFGNKGFSSQKVVHLLKCFQTLLPVVSGIYYVCGNGSGVLEWSFGSSIPKGRNLPCFTLLQ